MNQTDNPLPTEQANTCDAKAADYGDKPTPAMSILAGKVIGMIEKRAKGDDMAALMVEARKAFGLSPK